MSIYLNTTLIAKPFRGTPCRPNLFDKYKIDTATCLLLYRLQLKRELFWYGIIKKCTNFSQIESHGLKIGQIFAKFQCASFLIRNNVEKLKYGQTKTQK